MKATILIGLLVCFPASVLAQPPERVGSRKPTCEGAIGRAAREANAGGVPSDTGDLMLRCAGAAPATAMRTAYNSHGALPHMRAGFGTDLIIGGAVAGRRAPTAAASQYGERGDSVDVQQPGPDPVPTRPMVLVAVGLVAYQLRRRHHSLHYSLGTTSHRG